MNRLWHRSAIRTARLWLGAATLALCVSQPTAWADGEAAAPAKVERVPTAADESVAEKIVSLVGRHHYSHPEFNDAVSEELFDAYLRRLDPERMYFLQADIDEFTPYREILDDTLAGKGRMDFAYAAFDRLMQRMAERHAHMRARLEQPFDYALKEEMLLDRTEAPWAKDEAEINAIWDANLKNQLIVLILAEEEAAASKAAAEAAGEDAAAVEDKDPRRVLGLVAKSPQERIAQRYANYERWMEEKDGLDVMEMYLSTFTSLMDPHSTYWNWRTYEDFNIEMKLSFDGIGATLSSVDGYTVVVSIIAGGPASEDGRLQDGDIVTAVGQGDEEPESVINLPLDKVVRKIRGEKGSVVRLWVQKSLDDVPSVIDIKRGEVKLSEKEAKGKVHEIALPDGGTYKLGVVSLPGFYADTAALRRGDRNAKSATNDIKRLINDMIETDNIDGVVMDLRGNGGGFLFEAISLSGLFIPTGPVVQIRYPGTIEVREDEDDTYVDLPLVVMVDRSTASASEIFAAVIQDYGRGVVVGDKTTHGKGTVQDVMDLQKMVYSLRRAKPGALKFTVAKYYRVNGGSTQQKGVESDIVLPNFRDHMEIGEAYLPHVMVWDEIPEQPVKRTPHAVERLLGTLRASSEARRKADPTFGELEKVIAYFRERRERTKISLNIDERRKERVVDKEWTKRRDALLDTVDDEIDGGEEVVDEDGEKKQRDVYLDESLHILADLLRLSGHQAVAGAPDAPEGGEIKN